MNLVQRAVSAGGKLAPLIFPIEPGTVSLLNPSVFVDDDGDILVNVRSCNYILYHSEGGQMFPSRWGPLSYLHPETDRTLRTTNYLCRLNSDLEITDHTLVDTSLLDVPPLWEFIGEEDCRLVQWDGYYYLIGVRRDTTPNGAGRMELSKIKLEKKKWKAKEVSRIRIPDPADESAYCNKNWMPVLDRAFHFIKWSSPVEVVRTYPDLPPRCEQIALKQGVKPYKDQRGGSQLVRWGSVYISITHEVDPAKNYLGQKDGLYRHRLCVWDSQLNLVGLSKEFSFLDAKVEFVCGAAVHNGDLLISLGLSDNCAFVLRTPKVLIEDLIVEALSYEN